MQARLIAGDIFDESSYAVASGLFALAFALFSEGEYERATYYVTLAFSICKSIGAVNRYLKQHIYL